MKLKELGELLDLLREKGVVEFEAIVEDGGSPVRLKLGSFAAVPDAVTASSAAQVDDVKKEFQKLMASQPRGRDGLTASDQEDLYGTVVDTFPEEG